MGWHNILQIFPASNNQHNVTFKIYILNYRLVRVFC